MDHDMKHSAHDIVYIDTQVGSGGEIFFIAGLSNAE
jgi:hypothetical protein